MTIDGLGDTFGAGVDRAAPDVSFEELVAMMPEALREVFPPYRWHFGAVAIVTTQALTFDGPLVRALCQRDPALGYELTSRFLQVMGDRLQSARRRLQDCQRAAGHHNDL